MTSSSGGVRLDAAQSKRSKKRQHEGRLFSFSASILRNQGSVEL